MDPLPVDRLTAVRTATIGLFIGLMLVGLVFYCRDLIVAVAPGLAPFLQPEAAPRPKPRAGALSFDTELAARIAAAILWIVHLVVLVVQPIALPAILSRCRVLSVGRWLIMAAVCAFFALTAFATLGVASMTGAALLRVPLGAGVVVATVISSYGFMSLFFAVPGCLLAAAVHPKDGGSSTA